MVLQGDPVFGELTENITSVIRYFNTKVEQARGFGGWDWSVDNVLDVIKGGAPSPSQGMLSSSDSVLELLHNALKLELALWPD